MQLRKITNLFPVASLALVLATLTAGTSVAQNANQDQLRRGKALAEANCARCHATGLEGNSTHVNAPPFWSISARRPADTVADMLLKHISPKGSDMPTFEINRDQAEAVAAWINWVQPVSHGRRLVEQNCASCHGIGLDDESAHAEAPLFRELHKRYPIDALEEAFAEGIETGHPDMPRFDVNITQLSDIISYISTLEPDDPDQPAEDSE